jgi:anti-sigma B factor antagonist
MAISSHRAPPFSVDVQPGPGACIVAVTGEIDLTTAPAFASGVERAAASGQPVIVDLCDVSFCDSSGLRILLEQCERIVLSCTADGTVRRAVEASGVDRLFAVYDSRAAALRAVG